MLKSTHSDVCIICCYCTLSDLFLGPRAPKTGHPALGAKSTFLFTFVAPVFR